MATCQDCQQEMNTAHGCTADAVLIRGQVHARSLYTFADPGRRCGDCGAIRGRLHHMGCDVERCPRCGGQLIACGCTWTDEDDHGGGIAPVWTRSEPTRATGPAH